MPYTYAHYRFGEEVRKELPAELQTIVRRHLPLYHIGLHGPDILFYYRLPLPNRIIRQGVQIHRRTADVFFRRGLSVLRDTADPEAGLAYMLGVICHFVLDSECHGYIEYKVRKDGLTHMEMETEFDRLLLERDGLDPLRCCLTSHIVLRPGDSAVISGFFSDVRSNQIERALRSMIRYNRLLQAPNSGIRVCIAFLLCLTGHYRRLRGLLMPKHPRPGYEVGNAELLQRMGDAIPIACQLAENFYHVYTEMDILDRRFQRTFGADAAEVNRCEALRQPATAGQTGIPPSSV